MGFLLLLVGIQVPDKCEKQVHINFRDRLSCTKARQITYQNEIAKDEKLSQHHASCEIVEIILRQEKVLVKTSHSKIRLIVNLIDKKG